jgi:hypothetical protein
VVLVPLVRLRGRGALDEVLVGAAGVLIALALLGLVLEVVPGGLSRMSWGIGCGVLLLAGIGLTQRWEGTRRHPTPAARTFDGDPLRVERRRRTLREAPWFVAAAAVLAVAVVVATQAARQSERRPLALSVVDTRADGTVEFAVSAGPQAGRFTLTVRTGTQAVASAAAGTTAITTEPFHLDRFTTVHRSVLVPADRDATVTLQRVGATNALRTLTLDDHQEK